MGGERGHAGSNHVSSIYYNPAGLAFGHGTRGVVEGLFAYRSVDFTRDANAIDDRGTGTPEDAVGAQSGKAELRNTLISPFVGIASDLGVEGLGVGVGLYAPFGGQAKWNKNSAFTGNDTYPGAEDGPQRWSSIEAAQRSLYVTLGGAYRVNDKIGFGVGLNLVSSSVDLVRARNLDGSDDVVDAGGNVKEGRSLIEAKGLDVAISAGVMVKPTPCSRVGISYHSQPNFGEMSLEGTLTNKFGTGPVQPAADIEVRQALPDVFRIGGEWRALTKASLHAAIDYQRWSKYKNTCIMTAGTPGDCQVNPDGSGGAGLLVNVARNWQDTVTVRGGGRYFVSDTLEVNGGLTYDSSAVPKQEGTEYSSMEPALFDMTKVIGQLGAVYTMGNLELSGTLGYVHYMTVTTVPGAALESPSRNPDMAGTYKSFVGYALIAVGGSL